MYRDIASREIGVNGQRTDDWKTQCLYWLRRRHEDNKIAF